MHAPAAPACTSDSDIRGIWLRTCGNPRSSSYPGALQQEPECRIARWTDRAARMVGLPQDNTLFYATTLLVFVADPRAVMLGSVLAQQAPTVVRRTTVSTGVNGMQHTPGRTNADGRCLRHGAAAAPGICGSCLARIGAPDLTAGSATTGSVQPNTVAGASAGHSRRLRAGERR